MSNCYYERRSDALTHQSWDTNLASPSVMMSDERGPSGWRNEARETKTLASVRQLRSAKRVEFFKLSGTERSSLLPTANHGPNVTAGCARTVGNHLRYKLTRKRWVHSFATCSSLSMVSLTPLSNTSWWQDPLSANAQCRVFLLNRIQDSGSHSKLPFFSKISVLLDWTNFNSWT